jgi:phosphoribosyl-AMP cyclohydrolase
VVIVQQARCGFANAERHLSDVFEPRFDASGLIVAVVTDVADERVRMVAFMDREAFDRTRETGLAHFHSRSRGTLWLKGESSGNTLAVEEILVDCDQDALVLRCRPAGPTCHTGATSCFFRRLEGDRLEPLVG